MILNKRRQIKAFTMEVKPLLAPVTRDASTCL